MEREDENLCDDCGCDPCDCCDYCGYPNNNCQCCPECGCLTEECHCWDCGECNTMHYTCEHCGVCTNGSGEDLCDECGGHGHSSKAPWENTYPGKHKNGTDWGKVYPALAEGVDTIDPVQYAADFYLLEAMSAGVLHPMKGVKALDIGGETDEHFFKLVSATVKEKTKLRKARKARIAQQRVADPAFNLAYVMGQAGDRLYHLVEECDRVFVEYVHLACGGELRHHKAVGGRILSAERSSAWCGWKALYDKAGTDILIDMADLFDEFDDGSYGGPPWANAARILHSRLTGQLGPTEHMNKRMFIDRVWTLEHNGGCFLNKLSWAMSNKKGWQLDYIIRVLNAHAADEPDFKLLLKVASDTVRQLYGEYHGAVVAVATARGIDPPTPWLTTGKFEVRYLCKWCDHNPLIGHNPQCSYIQNDNHNKVAFNGDNWSTGKFQDWIHRIEEDDFEDWSWTTWRKTASLNAYRDTHGVLCVNPDVPVYLELAGTGTTGNGAHYSYLEPITLATFSRFDDEIFFTHITVEPSQLKNKKGDQVELATCYIRLKMDDPYKTTIDTMVIDYGDPPGQIDGQLKDLKKTGKTLPSQWKWVGKEVTANV